jgi:hypothetical protein
MAGGAAGVRAGLLRVAVPGAVRFGAAPFAARPVAAGTGAASRTSAGSAAGMGADAFDGAGRGRRGARAAALASDAGVDTAGAVFGVRVVFFETTIRILL